MSDKEIIIKSLQKAERRLRANRLFRDLSGSFSVFLVFPIAFKVCDLFWPFRGKTVTVVLMTWLLVLALYSFWKTMQAGTLEQTAAQLDNKVGLSDELKTAYWFISHPLASDWIDGQIRRASARISQLSIDRLFPRVIPASFYFAAVLLMLLVGLNFLPLPSNHNWIYLDAAPAFILTDAEVNFFAQAEQLLGRTDQLNKTDLAAAIHRIIEDLQEGRIGVDEALQKLKEIQKLLAESSSDADALHEKLNQIAQDLEASKQFKDAAAALQEKTLQDAAAAIAKAAQDLQEAAEGLKDQDQKAAGKALEAAAYLAELSEKVQGQKLKDEAAQQLQKLAQSLQKRSTGVQQASAPGEAKEGAREAPEVQSNPEGNDDEAGNAAADGSAAGPQVLQDSGKPRKDAPREGPPTEKLDVQLQQEQLTGQYDQADNPAQIEQTSKQERSKLDYRKVPSELSPAQRDVLSQKRIPWEYRGLIKTYFAAIQPNRKK